RAVRPDPDRVCGFPFLLPHIEVVVAGGTAPVDAARRLPGEEATVLPKILARTGALAPGQAVDHGRGTAARLEDQARTRLRQRAPLPAGVRRRPDLVLIRAPCRHRLIRSAP